ncbi:unnamed protein product [Bursaphelenchus okinawaensis]|uniref:CCHC-type domain-containing protein n=1 Tax=Bursaphelenchus okinawaensis TaxID=465554 RepID=A0A811KD14_9BILA|nr:unnamed protein product [Bursaphelenchus okinawaensis]CAG9101985.1 unnamed protein product [Bursaphelenchus okinawaensis]
MEEDAADDVAVGMEELTLVDELSDSDDDPSVVYISDTSQTEEERIPESKLKTRKEKKKEREDKYHGTPLTNEELIEMMNRHEDDIRKFLDEYLASPRMKEKNKDYKSTIDLGDKIAITFSILTLSNLRCNKISFVCTSLFQTKNHVAPKNCMVGYVQMNCQNGRLASHYGELISLLKDFLRNPEERSPIPDGSIPILETMNLIPNVVEQKRFSSFSLYCTCCEQHIKNMLSILEHVRCREHEFFTMRLQERRSLANFVRQLNNQKLLPLVSCIKAEIEFQKREVDAMIGSLVQLNICNFHNFLTNEITEKLAGLLKRKPEVHVVLFGGLPSSLATPGNPFVVDAYINFESKKNIPLNKKRAYLQKILNGEQMLDFAFPGGKVVMKYLGKPLTLFYTMDPKAEEAALLSKLLHLYASFFPDFYKAAIHIRIWGKRMGFNSTFDDRGVSGVVFDMMVLFFLQRKGVIPIVNEQALGMSFKEFFDQPYRFQIREFEEVGKQPRTFDVATVIFDLFSYYSAEFDPAEIIQIVDKNPVYKERKGTKTWVVECPMTKANLFQCRLEIDAFFQSVIFYSTVSAFQVKDHTGKLVDFERSWCSTMRGQKLPFLCVAKPSTRSNARIPQLMPPHNGTFHLHHGVYTPNLECDFCGERHVERDCYKLKMEAIDNKPVAPEVIKRLDDLISKQYHELKATEACLIKAKSFVDDLKSELRKHLSNDDIRLDLFGSLVSGFGSIASDLDVCLRLQHDEVTEQDIEVGKVLLKKTYDYLLRNKYICRLVSSAKVPIVKFESKSLGFSGDISFYNCLALHNSQMLREYCDFDERVPELGVAIKAWARAFDINDASQGTLSSYALIVMMIFYLQKLKIPVLPRLQDPTSCPDLNSEEEKSVGEWKVHYYKPTKEFKDAFKKNTQSVGELFAGFFDFYASYQYNEEVAQIRDGKVLTKIEKEWTKHLLAVEDPFDWDHNLCSGVRKVTGLYIMHTMNVMQHVLRTKRDIIRSPDFLLDKLDQFVPNTRGSVGKVCFHCHNKGHMIQKCPKLAEKRKMNKKLAIVRKQREAERKLVKEKEQQIEDETARVSREKGEDFKNRVREKLANEKPSASHLKGRDLLDVARARKKLEKQNGTNGTGKVVTKDNNNKDGIGNTKEVYGKKKPKTLSPKIGRKLMSPKVEKKVMSPKNGENQKVSSSKNGKKSGNNSPEPPSTSSKKKDSRKKSKSSK